MPLDVTTDPVEIAAVLEQAVAADPVGGTVLGTIAATLGDGGWCARSATGLAARSDPGYPVAITAGWLDADLPDLVAALAALPELAGVAGPPREAELVAGALADRRPGVTVTRRDTRLYRLDDLDEPRGVPGQARLATLEDLDLVEAWVRAFGVAAHPERVDDDNLDRRTRQAVAGGEVWLWVDGAPVSMARRQPTVAGSARIGPVYTPAEQRGHGYGSAVTARATRDVLDDGAVPVLFADLANATANDIYQQLGYYPVEDRSELHFG